MQKNVTWILCLSSLLISSMAIGEGELNPVEVMERAEKTIEILDQQFTARSKSECILTIPSISICECIQSNLGYRVGFRDYLSIRLLSGVEETEYIKNRYTGYSLDRAEISKISTSVDQVFQKCATK